MPIDFSEYDELVHQIYDAALNPTAWPDTLSAIAHACASPQCAMVTTMHPPAQGGFTLITQDVPPHLIERWSTRYRAEDPYAAALVRRGLFVDGCTMNGADLVPFDELVRTNFYRELIAPTCVTQLCTSVVFDAVDAHKLPTVLTIFRSKKEPAFGHQQLDLLRRLSLHVSHALGVMFHLRDSAFQVAASQAALDRLAAGVVLLNARGDVKFCNSAALRQFRAKHTAVLLDAPSAGDRLLLAPRLQHYGARFQHMLRDAVMPLAFAPDHFSNALLLPDAEGKPSCVIHVAPLGQTSALAMGADAPRAVMFLYDLTAASRVPPALLSELFGLTPAEARAALQMLQGGTAEDMAQRLGVTAHTFKSQLKVVYAKSCTHRQADLLKMLLALNVA